MKNAGTTAALSRGQEAQFTADAKRCLSLLKQAASAYSGGKNKRHHQLAAEALKLARRMHELASGGGEADEQLIATSDKMLLSALKALGLSYWSEETAEGNELSLPLLVEAQEILERASEPDYYELYEVYEALCQLYVATKQVTRYEEICRKALALKEKEVGQWDAGLVSFLIDLGWALEEQGKFTESASIKRDAYKLSLNHKGEAHPETISLKHGVAYTTFLSEGMSQFDAVQKALDTLTPDEKKKFQSNVAAELESLR